MLHVSFGPIIVLGVTGVSAATYMQYGLTSRACIRRFASAPTVEFTNHQGIKKSRDFPCVCFNQDNSPGTNHVAC